MFIGERLKELRLEKRITQKELGNKFNITHATINRYEKGVHQPDTDLINRFAEFFNVSTDYLLGSSNFKDKLPNGTWKTENFTKIPVLDVIRAREPLYTEQNIISYVYLTTDQIPSSEVFFLKVVGDSMNLSNIVDGCLVLVKVQDEVENGEIAAVLVNDDEATIKRFYKTDTTVTLMPHSSNTIYQPRIINIKNDNVMVIGKVVKAVINF